MTSTAYAVPPVAPARTANHQQMGALLDTKASVGIGSRLRSIPRKMREWARNMMERLRLGTLGDKAQALWSRFKGLAGKVLSPFRKIGLVNIIGSLLTCQTGRDVIRKTVGKVYAVASMPVRWIGRILAWPLNRFEAGRKFTAKVSKSVSNLEVKVAVKLEAGLQWLDDREHSGAMRWARPFFQGSVCNNMIKGYAPANLRTPLYIANLFVPTIGVGQLPEQQTEFKFSPLLGNVRVNKPTVETEPASEASWSTENIVGVNVETGKKVIAYGLTDPDGDRWVKVDGQLFTEGDLPEHFKVGAEAKTLLDTLEAQALKESMEKAAAANGEAPTNRAAKRAQAKAHGPAHR